MKTTEMDSTLLYSGNRFLDLIKITKNRQQCQKEGSHVIIDSNQGGGICYLMIIIA